MQSFIEKVPFQIYTDFFMFINTKTALSVAPFTNMV